jgi:hypothetical protein
MNIEQLKQKLKPALHTFEIETGITVQIHRPTQRDLPECKSLESTLVLCVKDENGDPVFSTEDVEGVLTLIVSILKWQIKSIWELWILSLLIKLMKLKNVAPETPDSSCISR